MELAVPVIGILRGIHGDFLGDLMDAAAYEKYCEEREH